ncbi:MAG: 4Fe-4S dicluster domain-containing protein [Cyclobacteriaceae bacterium]|nr:4Fe-4S dicluster domain-containing protein [Cyclobacteriaceae bacterium]
MAKKSKRRSFIKYGLAAGAVALTSGPGCVEKKDEEEEGEKVRMLTTDGKLVEIDRHKVREVAHKHVPPEEAREGIPGKKWVMVIDLSRCRNARKCVTRCQEMHYLAPEDEWIKVFLMQDSADTAPYWFPKPCFHCNQPPCVKVCPVGATYKRTDGIVLVDNERCIGCKFCMTACPYSSRVFHWKEPEGKEEAAHNDYSPETSVPALVGTVGKCDFCPDMARMGKLPVCVTGCPNGAILFGDKNEDIVSNGSETFRFSELIYERAGYHFMAELGTEPNVYYLPPVDRMFDYELGFKTLSEEQQKFYRNSIVKKH